MYHPCGKDDMGVGEGETAEVGRPVRDCNPSVLRGGCGSDWGRGEHVRHERKKIQGGCEL